MSEAEIIERHFWATVVVRAAMTANEAQKNILKQRLATECKQYVALSLGEMVGQPTSHIYRGSSGQLLEEVITKARSIRQEW